jgi:hypothetical protein
VGSEVGRGSEVQHGEEERCERGGAVVEAGGGHLKRAGSGASERASPSRALNLPCLCLVPFGSNARLGLHGNAVWATTVGMPSHLLCKNNGMQVFAAPLAVCVGPQHSVAATLDGGARKRENIAHVGSCL